MNPIINLSKIHKTISKVSFESFVNLNPFFGYGVLINISNF